MATEPDKQADIADVVETLQKLSPVQVEVLRAIIKRFATEQAGEHVLKDFLSTESFDFFSMRLAAHHAYSSHQLKKENFEHILEQAFRRAGAKVVRANSMTVRGADLTVDGVTLSLKTEAAQGLKSGFIKISKLMEAAWIKQVTKLDDIPGFIAQMVMPHFANYDRIFILRSYADTKRKDSIRYDLHEIPKPLLMGIGDLKAADFSELTKTRTTSASVISAGKQAFKFRLDGSDDKLTITNLDVTLCPLHAWWSLAKPD